MPGPTVEAVVQKALREAPPVKAEDSPDSTKAPTEQPTKASDASGSKESTSLDSSTRTAFEQELIDELESDEQTEFDALSEPEQHSRLDWMKRRYRREARQRTEDGKIRKAWNALIEAGVKSEDLRALVAKRQSASSPAEAAKVEAAIKRGFARKLDQAETAEEREAIQDAEQTVSELIDDRVEQALAKRVKPLEERLEANDRQRNETRRKTLESEINDLEEKEGFKTSLVETYREDIRTLGLRHPDWSAWKLLHYLATEEELKQGKRANGAVPKEPPPPARATPVVRKPSGAPASAPGAKLRFSLEKTIGNILRRK